MENQESISKANRERAREKKQNSDANLAMYEDEISLGPEFVCVCCNAGFFKHQVFEFTNKKKEQIKPENLKDHVFFMKVSTHFMFQ